MITQNRYDLQGDTTYQGNSTDVKPTENVAPNSLFLELDTNDLYYFNEGEWSKVEGGGSGPTPTGTINITANGNYNVSQYANADVDVQPVLQGKVASPSDRPQQIRPDTGYDGLGEVLITPIPPEYIIPTGTLPITENGTFDVSQYALADVSVQSQASSEVLWTSIGGEEYGVISYSPDDLTSMFDEIRFTGARGQSTNLALGQYLSSRIRSASSSGNNLPVQYVATIGGVRTLQTIMVEFGSTNASITFNVQSHFNVVNPASPDISVVYEPSNQVKLYQIVGYKY